MIVFKPRTVNPKSPLLTLGELSGGDLDILSVTFYTRCPSRNIFVPLPEQLPKGSVSQSVAPGEIVSFFFFTFFFLVQFFSVVLGCRYTP